MPGVLTNAWSFNSKVILSLSRKNPAAELNEFVRYRTCHKRKNIGYRAESGFSPWQTFCVQRRDTHRKKRLKWGNGAFDVYHTYFGNHMIINFTRIAFRHIRQSPLYSFINVAS